MSYQNPYVQEIRHPNASDAHLLLKNRCPEGAECRVHLQFPIDNLFLTLFAE